MMQLDDVARSKVLETVRERVYSSGAYVAHAGEPATAWIGVVEGLLKVSCASPDGRTVMLTGVTSGGWLGEGVLLNGEPRRYDVIAVRHAHVAFVPRSTFEWLVESSSAFNKFLISQLNARLGQYVGAVQSDRLRSIEGRVAHFISALFDPTLYPQKGHTIALSQEELGELVGLSRQRIGVALRNLRALGLLDHFYGNLRVLDLRRLRAFEGSSTR